MKTKILYSIGFFFFKFSLCYSSLPLPRCGFIAQVLTAAAAAVESKYAAREFFPSFLPSSSLSHTHARAAVGLPPSSFPTRNVSPTWNGELYILRNPAIAAAADAAQLEITDVDCNNIAQSTASTVQCAAFRPNLRGNGVERFIATAAAAQQQQHTWFHHLQCTLYLGIKYQQSKTPLV